MLVIQWSSLELLKALAILKSSLKVIEVCVGNLVIHDKIAKEPLCTIQILKVVGALMSEAIKPKTGDNPCWRLHW